MKEKQNHSYLFPNSQKRHLGKTYVFDILKVFETGESSVETYYLRYVVQQDKGRCRCWHPPN